ncbi:biopolymer transporter ExbD [Aliikangiella marina]|uniref:Biopolymer transporter ExbD n=1 Tax=Aliikangiella marina TaxID=1712262 RepID=A0A545TGT7_9GAMM|nr:biopolymer transporter ExbD [Aliikangiella marina]TQV76425.1 biopolymer transporter ExbD [Aliikangiella marina]
MEMSARAKRMQRSNKLRKQPALNLVSLMDIFTILVFFLLVTSSSSQQLPNTKDLRLPNSTAKKAPEETLIIMVTERNILVQGRNVANLQDVVASDDKVIGGLKKELEFQSSNKTQLTNDEDSASDGFAVTIMGDENLPFEVLSRILATCRQANYTKIAFAANQKAKQ